METLILLIILLCPGALFVVGRILEKFLKVFESNLDKELSKYELEE